MRAKDITSSYLLASFINDNYNKIVLLGQISTNDIKFMTDLFCESIHIKYDLLISRDLFYNDVRISIFEECEKDNVEIEKIYFHSLKIYKFTKNATGKDI